MHQTAVMLIGVSADCKSIDGQPFHAVGEKYLTAVTQAAGGTPLIIPALAEQLDPAGLLERLDGLLLTGSPSNLHPLHYGAEATTEHEPFDPARDALTLKLIGPALERGLPLLAICRGFQELNAALGGTLHPALHQLPGRLDHRRPQSEDLAVQYGPQHRVRFVEGGEFRRRFGVEEIKVNTLHRQGIAVLAPRLRAEGHAPDGTIEAVSVGDAPGFALGVQWHPEYKAIDNPFSRRLFKAFGEAVRDYVRQRSS